MCKYKPIYSLSPIYVATGVYTIFSVLPIIPPENHQTTNKKAKKRECRATEKFNCFIYSLSRNVIIHNSQVYVTAGNRRGLRDWCVYVTTRRRASTIRFTQSCIYLWGYKMRLTIFSGEKKENPTVLQGSNIIL